MDTVTMDSINMTVFAANIVFRKGFSAIHMLLNFQRPVRVVVLRRGEQVVLSLIPQQWSGRGLLGWAGCLAVLLQVVIQLTAFSFLLSLNWPLPTQVQHYSIVEQTYHIPVPHYNHHSISIIVMHPQPSMIRYVHAFCIHIKYMFQTSDNWWVLGTNGSNCKMTCNAEMMMIWHTGFKHMHTALSVTPPHCPAQGWYPTRLSAQTLQLERREFVHWRAPPHCSSSPPLPLLVSGWRFVCVWC